MTRIPPPGSFLNVPSPPKQAQETPLFLPRSQVINAQLGREKAHNLINTLLGAGLASMGAAGAYRSLAGVNEYLQDRSKLNPQINRIRKKQKQLDREERRQDRQARKTANDTIASKIDKALQSVGVDVGKHYRETPTARTLVEGSGGGSLASSPLFLPGLMLTVGGGLYGGYTLADRVFNQMHAARMKNHERKARELYEEEIRRAQSKKASAGGDVELRQEALESTRAMLQALAQQTKTANWGHDLVGTTSGAAIAAALALLAGGHMLGRTHRKDKEIASKSKLRRELDAAVPYQPADVAPLV